MSRGEFIKELNDKMEKDNRMIKIIIEVFLVLLVLFVICLFIGRYLPKLIVTIICDGFIGVTFFGGAFIIWKKKDNKFFLDLIKYLEGNNTNYKTYKVSQDRFVTECMSGLLESYIKINNKFYYIETQLKMNSTKEVSKDNIGDCYINNECIQGYDNFMNYVIDGVALKDFREIEFITYFNNRPDVYFEKSGV